MLPCYWGFWASGIDIEQSSKYGTSCQELKRNGDFASTQKTQDRDLQENNFCTNLAGVQRSGGGEGNID